MKTTLIIRLPLALAATLLLPGMAGAKEQAISETLNGPSAGLSWSTFNGACLTAGNGTGTIPACVGLPYYAGKTLVGGDNGVMPDAAGFGALRLTNGDNLVGGVGTNGNNQTGSIVSNFTFGTADGIQITWTSVSYGGNNYNGTGADGTVFFLSDGTLAPTIGAFGGSLGYSCANGKNPSDGVTGGYLGVGIDEFGNFSNPGDNTDTGPGFFAGRIGVRGAGFTSWNWLANSAAFGKYYKGAANATAIQKTCASGYAYNYSGASITDSKGNTIPAGGKTGDKLPFNYPLLKSVPVGTTLANQQAVAKPTRQAAIPIVFSLKITSDGLLDFSYSAAGGATQAVVTGLRITDNNGPLPASFRFGFSSGTGGGSNVHEITCFKAEPADVANTTAGANVQQGQVVLTATQVFLAFYHPVNWWGSMTANALNYDASKDLLTASTTSTWDGGCVLTGGDCQTMTPQTTPATAAVQVSVQAPSSRAILTYNAGGVPFQTANLSAAQLAQLGGNAAEQAIELDYLRGVRTNEQTNPTSTPGTLRNRTSVLADIVDSSPVWVGPPGFNYANPWSDKLYSATTMPEGSTSYAAFQTTNASRMNMVYVGSNDGLLHGFRAGVLNSSGTALTSNDGQELLAYMPNQVINAIHYAPMITPPPTPTYDYSKDYSHVLYQHNFQVDGTPGMGDLFYGNNWHTWLVTGLGVGGHPLGPVNSNATVNSSGVATQLIPDPIGTLFALDITKPADFSEANASTLVIGEWNSATLTCVGNLTCNANMGQVVGTPLIRRLHDGTWGVIWGNGLNSKTGRAGIYILHVNSAGVQSFQYIDAGQGPNNGIVQVTAADLDGDHITDYVYAGDVLGTLWRFDLTKPVSTAWPKADAVFTTVSGQPISTAPVVTQLPVANATGYPKLLISFGTGQKLPIVSASPELYATGTQAIYGVWDANMTAWNSTATDQKYDALTTPGQPMDSTALLAQTATNVPGNDNLTYRTLTKDAVCWNGSLSCPTGNTKMGWKINLPGTNEQVIYNPIQIEDSFVVNTTIPPVNAILNCSKQPATGFTMTPDLFNGGGDNAPLQDGKANTDGSINYYSGVGANGSGTPTELNVQGNTHLGFETTTGNWTGPKFNRKGGKVSKVTWTKVR